MQKFNFKKMFLIIMIISLVFGALIGIHTFLLGSFIDEEIRILLTTLTIGVYSLTGLCCSVLYEKGRFTPLALSGIVLSIIGFLFTTFVLWEIIDSLYDHIWQIPVIILIATVSITHSCLLLFIRSDKALVKGLLSATIILISIVALFLIIFTLKEFDIMNDFYFRILGVFAILDVLGTVVTPIVNKIYSMEN